MKFSKMQNSGNQVWAQILAQVVLVSALILFAVVMRFLPHLSNVTPILAIALLSGFHFKNRSVAVLVPLLAMFVSDLVIGFHSTLVFVYSPILVVVFFGLWMRAHHSRSAQSPQNTKIWPIQESFGWTLAGSLLFFLVSNFGVWETQNFYSHNFAGLMTCLAAGIPFFEKSLLGDMMFTGLVFSFYVLACEKFSFLNPQTEVCHGR